MKKLFLAAITAASIAICVHTSGIADEQSPTPQDFRSLNHQAIESMRTGKLAEAEELFTRALAVYTPEPTHYDESIRSNLLVLRESGAYKALHKESKEASHTLQGQVNMTLTDRLLEFAQAYFDRAATEKLQRVTNVPMKAARIKHYKLDEAQLRYSAELIGNRIFEIVASVQELPDGTYKMLSLRSDIYRQNNLKAEAIAWNLEASLKSPLEAAQTQTVLKAIAQEEEGRKLAEHTRMLQDEAQKREEERKAKEQEEAERIAAENKRIAEENERGAANAAAAQAAAATYLRSNGGTIPIIKPG